VTDAAGTIRAMARLAALLVLLAGLVAWADDPASPKPDDELAWRARKPDVSLLLVGGQLGEMRPSRATTPPVGGLERLAALVDRLRRRPKSGPDGFAGISLGWSMAGSGEAEEEAKADLYRAVLRPLGFRALLLGVPDLSVAAMRQAYDPGTGAAPSGLDAPCPPVNVLLAGVPPEAMAPTFVDTEVGGLPLRILTLVDPEAAQRLQGSGIARASVSTSMVLQGLLPRPESLWIVGAWLSDAQLEELPAGLRRLGPAVIVDLSRRAGVERVDARIGDAPLVVSFDGHGRSVGILDLDRTEDGGWKASYRSFDLVEDMDAWESPLRDAVRDGYFAHYRKDVRDRQYLRRFANTYADPSGLRYVGSAACAKCHPGIYDEWANSAHADAMATLQRTGDAYDPECARCHAVGFERLQDGRWTRTASAFLDPERTQYLGGVGCESCHGPGSGHRAAPDDRSLWEPGRPNRARPGVEACAVCHDEDQDADFRARFETLRALVDHARVPAELRTVRPQNAPGGGR
jgi:hypothetical protein